MTLTILASVSLLALVSTARPIPKVEDDWTGLQVSKTGESTDLQHAIQAVIKSHAATSEERDLSGEDVQLLVTSVEEVQAYLSNAGDDSVKALVRLNEDELHSPDEKELYEILTRIENERGRRTPVPDDALDSASLVGSPLKTSSDLELIDVDEAERAPSVGDSLESLESPGVSKPVVVIFASCLISLLALCCIATGLYIVEVFRNSVFRSRVAWEILPRLEKDAVERSGMSNGVAGYHREAIGAPERSRGNPSVSTNFLQVPPLSTFRSSGMEKHAERAEKATTAAEYVDSGDDLDEKFYDAASSAASSPYATPRISFADLPSGEPLPQASEPPAPPEMDEVPTPVRPSWSLRASEAKLPTVGGSNSNHGNGNPGTGSAVVASDGDTRRERRAYGAMPGLDAALAMQLRPGLGIGADAAWLVRFVMALFGWCAVLVSGTGAA